MITARILLRSFYIILLLVLTACETPSNIKETGSDQPISAEKVLTFTVDGGGRYTVYKVESHEEGVVFYIVTLPGGGIKGFAAVAGIQEGE